MTKRTTLLPRDYVFFRRHAGWVVGENAKGALALARAERQARERGLTAEWLSDDDADWSWLDQPEFKRQREQDHIVEGCVVRPPCSQCGHRETAASLWGIFDADAEYRRVVEAELFLEVLSNA